MTPPPALAVTLGDPAGVGPEVAARAMADALARGPARLLAVGPARALARAAGALKLDLPLHPLRALAAGDPWAEAPPGALPVLDTAPDTPLPHPGAPTAASGRIALDALAAACDLCLVGAVAGMVTAPLSKAAVRLGRDDGFVGQTEYLAHRAGGAEVRMMLAGGGLRVVLATTHVALWQLPERITPEGVYRTIRLTRDALARHEALSAPRIAVCGLNPHPGEFGDEDAVRVAPAVERARGEGIAVDGPFSADALFARVREAGYDAVVAMYHDQGLIPVKLLAPDGAVNVTLGLPFVRTAPGHGTAFDRAGRGTAHAGAMAAALALAYRWASAPAAAGRAG